MASHEPRPIIGAGSIEMPDLSGIVGRSVPMRITHALVGGPQPAHHHLQALAWMIDRAAYAYERARDRLDAAASAGEGAFPIHELMRGTDYLEIAINATLRAHLLGERLRRAASAPPISRRELLASDELARLRNMRHFAEHVDEQIERGSIGQTSSLIVGAQIDRIDYAGQTISYAELADWIARLEALARRLLEAPSVSD